MKRITKRSLNEGYAVILGEYCKPFLHFVDGVDVGNGLAVIYNDRAEAYSLTDIETGMCVNASLSRLEEINEFLNDDEKMKELLNQIKKCKSNVGYCTELYKMLVRKEEKAYQFKS